MQRVLCQDHGPKFGKEQRMHEKTPHICYECDSEFFVFPTDADEEEVEVSFCPYCGSELESIEEDDIIDEYDEE